MWFCSPLGLKKLLKYWKRRFSLDQGKQKTNVFWHSSFFLIIITGLPSIFLCWYKYSVHIVLCHSSSNNKGYIRKKKFFFYFYVGEKSPLVPEGCGLIGLWATSHSTMSDKSCCCMTQNQMLQSSFLPSTVLELHPLMFMIFSHEYHLGWPVALNGGTGLPLASS